MQSIPQKTADVIEILRQASNELSDEKVFIMGSLKMNLTMNTKTYIQVANQ